MYNIIIYIQEMALHNTHQSIPNSSTHCTNFIHASHHLDNPCACVHESEVVWRLSSNCGELCHGNGNVRRWWWKYTGAFYQWCGIRWCDQLVSVICHLCNTHIVHLLVSHFEGGVKSPRVGASHLDACVLQVESAWSLAWGFYCKKTYFSPSCQNPSKGLV